MGVVLHASTRGRMLRVEAVEKGDDILYVPRAIPVEIKRGSPFTDVARRVLYVLCSVRRSQLPARHRDLCIKTHAV